MGTIDTLAVSSVADTTHTRIADYPAGMAADLSTPHGRLRHARKEKGLTVQELAERTGINVNTLKKHEQPDGNAFDAPDAKRYARALGPPFHWLWLLHNVEHPSKEALTTYRSSPGKPPKKFLSGDELPQGSGGSLISIREVDAPAGAAEGGGEMPAAYIRGRDGQWHPSDAIAAHAMFPETWLLSLGLDPGRTDLFRVRGDSMSPEIEDGDWVFVDLRVQRLIDEDIYLIYDGWGIKVKSLAIVHGSLGTENPRIRIISTNPKYPVDEMPADDIVIYGRVRHRIGRIVRGR